MRKSYEERTVAVSQEISELDTQGYALVWPNRFGGDISEGSWREDALCPQVDLEAHNPESRGSIWFAKQICALCGVCTECGDYALDNRIDYGVWGGLSKDQRRKILAIRDETA